MGERIETSTPLIFNKFIPPPPRRLWSADSPTEQLYRNKWAKYRNSISEKDPWSALDSSHFVSFKDLSDGHDNYFDIDETEETLTPLKTGQHSSTSASENNNIIEELAKCTLSVIREKGHRKGDFITDSSQLDAMAKVIPDSSTEKPALPTTKKRVTIQLNNNVEKKRLESKIGRRDSTIVEPFSFESREKYRQEHHQARRERDSVGKELPKGFRANPVPNYLKIREKLNAKPKLCPLGKHTEKFSDLNKIYDGLAMPKKKGFQPVHPQRLPIVPKAPNLLTAVRAKERQRFEEQIRRKEEERQELRRKEEAERKKREEEEIAKLRRELVHKPQPIRCKLAAPKLTKRELSEASVLRDCKRLRKC